MVTFAVSGLPAIEVAAAFWLGSVVVAAEVGSVVTGVFADASLVAGWALPCGVFGVTGVAAATAVVTAVASAAVVPLV